MERVWQHTAYAQPVCPCKVQKPTQRKLQNASMQSSDVAQGAMAPGRRRRLNAHRAQVFEKSE